jgi:hypothetical protein
MRREGTEAIGHKRAQRFRAMRMEGGAPIGARTARPRTQDPEHVFMLFVAKRTRHFLTQRARRTQRTGDRTRLDFHKWPSDEPRERWQSEVGGEPLMSTERH